MSNVTARRRVCLLVLAVAASLFVAQPGLADRGKENGNGEGRGGPRPATTTTEPQSQPGHDDGHRGRDAQTTQGVVQTITARYVVLRRLDGSTVSFAINRRTRIQLGRRAGRIKDVRPGFIVVANSTNGKSASELRFVRAS
jgi:hypothetical protein